MTQNEAISELYDAWRGYAMDHASGLFSFTDCFNEFCECMAVLGFTRREVEEGVAG